MKKIIITGVCALLCTPAFAEEPLYDNNYRCEVSAGLMCAQIGKELHQIFSAKVEWVKEIKAEEQLAQPDGYASLVKHSQPARKFQETKAPTRAAKSRISEIRQLVQQHPAIGEYTLIVPNPDSIANLTDAQFDFIKNFLQQPIVKKSFDATYEPQVSHPTKDAPETQLTFNNAQGKKMFLIFDSKYTFGRGKWMYFFVDSVPNA